LERDQELEGSAGEGTCAEPTRLAHLGVGQQAEEPEPDDHAEVEQA
jgi:hypothetical protein